MTDYKSLVDLDKRIVESQRVVAKYPDRIPVIVDCASKQLGILLTKKKFLVPRELSVVSFLNIIRTNHTRPSAGEAVFLFCENRLVMPSMLMHELYDMYKESNNTDHKKGDLFLYLQLSRENAFGRV